MTTLLQCYATIAGTALLGGGALKISSCALNDLPEIEDSENAFGMYLDGYRWVPTAFSNSSKKAFYYDSTMTLRISANNNFKGENARFSFYINNMSGPGIYNASFVSRLSEFPHCRDSTRYDPDDKCEDYYKLVNASDSYIEIVEFDSADYKVSGFFNMILVDDSGEEVNITEGRFRLDMNPF
jgi:hypothetical protein